VKSYLSYVPPACFGAGMWFKKNYNTYEHDTYHQVKGNLLAAIAAVRIMQAKMLSLLLINNHIPLMNDFH